MIGDGAGYQWSTGLCLISHSRRYRPHVCRKKAQYTILGDDSDENGGLQTQWL
jgi:hypothetical protein